MTRLPFQYDDGGRKAAGYQGDTGDCVVRAITIASGLPYQTVYDVLSEGTRAERPRWHERTKGRRGSRSVRNGVDTRRTWFKAQMAAWGFQWTPTMGIGTGCRVHLRPGEIPSGRLVVAVSKHYTAVIDGVIRDTHDAQRDTGRCCYGYYRFIPPTHE